MSPRTRLFFLLWVAGFGGAVSFLLIDFEALVAFLPAEVMKDALHITQVIQLLSLVQPAILAYQSRCLPA